MIVSNCGLVHWGVLYQKDQRFMSILHDKYMRMWQMEFIVDVQNLTQWSEGKLWKNQPRWLVRGTKESFGEAITYHEAIC